MEKPISAYRVCQMNRLKSGTSFSPTGVSGRYRVQRSENLPTIRMIPK